MVSGALAAGESGTSHQKGNRNMSKREIGQHRDAHLELERLARLSGPILESAVQSLIAIHAQFFNQSGPDLRHRLTGQTIEEWVTERRKSNPNDYADYEPVSGEQIEHEIIENACLRPQPATLAKLFKAVGETRYHEILKMWGTDPARMLPGTRPGYVKEKSADKPEGPSARSNPWSDKWDRTPAEAEAEKARLLRALGTKACAAMAAACGVSVLGAPLRK
jgi:hypothetical protein